MDLLSLLVVLSLPVILAGLGCVCMIITFFLLLEEEEEEEIHRHKSVEAASAAAISDEEGGVVDRGLKTSYWMYDSHNNDCRQIDKKEADRSCIQRCSPQISYWQYNPQKKTYLLLKEGESRKKRERAPVFTAKSSSKSKENMSAHSVLEETDKKDSEDDSADAASEDHQHPQSAAAAPASRRTKDVKKDSEDDSADAAHSEDHQHPQSAAAAPASQPRKKAPASQPRKKIPYSGGKKEQTFFMITGVNGGKLSKSKATIEKKILQKIKDGESMVAIIRNGTKFVQDSNWTKNHARDETSDVFGEKYVRLYLRNREKMKYEKVSVKIDTLNALLDNNQLLLYIDRKNYLVQYHQEDEVENKENTKPNPFMAFMTFSSAFSSVLS